MLRSKLGWKRLLLVLCIAAVAIGLLSVRPWRTTQPECYATVRPGESIQEAIDAAEPGTVICLARGVWTENVAIDKPLTLVGKGATRTTIRAARIFQPVVQISGQHGEPVEVKLKGIGVSGDAGGSGFTVSGAAVVEIMGCAVSGRSYGIEIADSAYLTLSGSTITDARHRGVVLAASARASISASRISGNLGPGFWIAGSAEAVLVDCEISRNLGHGFWLRDEARVALSDCSISSNQGHGLWLTGQSAAQLLRSDVSNNWDQGVRADDSADLDLTDSDVQSNWHGVELRHGAQGKITGSAVSGNRFDGIRIQNASEVTVLGSTVAFNSRGIGVWGQADAEISGNLIKYNSGYGLFSWSATEIRGEGNEFRENGVDLGGNLAGSLRIPLKEPRETAIRWPDDRYASLQEAIDALLPGGELLLEPGSYTVGLTIGKSLLIEADQGQVTLRAKGNALPTLSLVDGAYLRLAGATVSGGSTGVAVSAGARAVLVGCTISENTEGINLSHSSSAEMVDCHITRNERGGVVVGGAAQTLITGCSVSSNHGYGIAAADAGQVSITDSTVARNAGEGGILLWGSSEAVLETNSIVDNNGFGVAMFQRPCFVASRLIFRGRISGSGNVFEANQRGDVCPPELDFLSTAEGGELDLRPSVSS